MDRMERRLCYRLAYQRSKEDRLLDGWKRAETDQNVAYILDGVPEESLQDFCYETLGLDFDLRDRDGMVRAITEAVAVGKIDAKELEWL